MLATPTVVLGNAPLPSTPLQQWQQWVQPQPLLQAPAPQCHAPTQAPTHVHDSKLYVAMMPVVHTAAGAVIPMPNALQALPPSMGHFQAPVQVEGAFPTPLSQLPMQGMPHGVVQAPTVFPLQGAMPGTAPHTPASSAASDAEDKGGDGAQLIVNYVADTVPLEELQALFTPHGKVDLVRIIHDKDSGRRKGFGFVYYRRAEEAAAAAAAVNGVELHGKKLKVSCADVQRPIPRGGLAAARRRAKKREQKRVKDADADAEQ